jgi:NADP-dependent aldehyde dehydrogenase
MTSTTQGSRLEGRSLLGVARLAAPDAEARRFRGVDPREGQDLAPAFQAARPDEVTEAGRLAAAAFRAYAGLPGSRRAAFLRRIVDALEAGRDEVVARAGQETALSDGRLGGELTRTTKQLGMFATLIEDDAWRDPRIDPGDPDRTPAPKPDVRSLRRALGPVAVFGSSNFPLAFSVAGGDTASALAAGCPVIVKAHPSHPGTSELVGRAVAEAAQEADLPEGVFSLLFGDGHQVGAQLVQLPAVQAVGFTAGS